MLGDSGILSNEWSVSYICRCSGGVFFVGLDRCEITRCRIVPAG